MALFTVIEGADGCGKTTQVKLLCEKLEQMGLGSVEMSFPRYQTAVGRVISQNLLGNVTGGPDDVKDIVLQALNTYDKYEAAEDIRDHLRLGRNVVSSRWWQSAVAYGSSAGINIDSLMKAHTLLPRADLNILLWMPEDESLTRRPAPDRLEKDRDLQKQVFKTYQTMWSHHGARSISGWSVDSSWMVVDGRDDEKTVHLKIWKGFLRVLEIKSRRALAELNSHLHRLRTGP